MFFIICLLFLKSQNNISSPSANGFNNAKVFKWLYKETSMRFDLVTRIHRMICIENYRLIVKVAVNILYLDTRGRLNRSL